MKKKIGIAGLGLIGGSLAKALKLTDIETRITGFDKEPVLDTALEEEIIDRKVSNMEDLAEADIVFLCMPSDMSLQAMDKLAPVLGEGTILTDVCSVKGALHRKWETLESDGLYIGGHPMTGKESSGIENSDPLLFENATYILTDAEALPEKTKELTDLIEILGAKIIYLDPELHDRIAAYISHLPHLLAVSLVNIAAREETGTGYLDFAAGGFRDMTRIASHDFSMWHSVIELNRDEILMALDEYRVRLGIIKDAVADGRFEEIEKMFSDAAFQRDGIPKSNKGFIRALHDLYIYANDEPGVISRISSALFEQGINIKDIELLKIREGTGGTFRISVSSTKDVEVASAIIKNLGFRVKED